MNDYKNYLISQLGIKKSQVKPSIVEQNAFPGIDPEDPNEEPLKQAGNLKDLLAPVNYTSPRSITPTGLSPTAIVTPVIAVAVRGSSTGGLPSGVDQTGIPSSTPTGRLGGYEPIPTGDVNSVIANKTPSNPEISSPNIKTDNPQTVIDPHPHQTQKNTGEPPQAVTGASTDSQDTLTLKSAMPKGVDIDVPEENQKEDDKEDDKDKVDGKDKMDGEVSMEEDDEAKQGLHEGKHKPGCQCGFCKNKGSFGKKKTEEKKDNTEECMDEKKEDKKDKVDETFVRHKAFAFDRMKSVGTIKTATVNECVTCGCGNMDEKHPPGASHPFVTHWEMDPEKAGYVKVDEEKWMQDLQRKSEKKGTVGALHKDMGVPQGKKIPTDRLKSLKATLHKKSERGALSDKELTLSKRVNSALNMRGEK